MTTDLKTLLTSELFKLMVDNWIPFDQHEPIDFSIAIRETVFERKPEYLQLRPQIMPALKALSLVGLDNMPNLWDFLPPPDDPSYPRQALGLLLLLDQATRLFLRGINTRWTYAYFGEIAKKCVEHLNTFPSHLHPASWSRWQGTVSIDYFVLVRLWFGTPMVHHEKMGTEAVAFTEGTRELVEQIHNVRDAFRDQPNDRWGLDRFAIMLKEGPPKSPCGVAEGAFWIACLMDVHKPLLDVFGRYPAQNGRLGRVDTPEEEAWLEKSEIFQFDPEARRAIREDVELGRWTPIQD
ncbi:hypothetical protein BX600DRAFT_14131 [Xylariales sp. PMI_506]|nr:hypothetical protein BX600DRAFT_14131 [Xylariales sp. PMI_506]